MSLKSQEAEEGNSLTLRCELSKKGVPVQWHRDGQPLTEELSQGKYEIKLEGRTAQMTIVNVQQDDAGKYSCITGDEKTTAEVKVKCKCAVYFSLVCFIISTNVGGSSQFVKCKDKNPFN